MMDRKMFPMIAMLALAAACGAEEEGETIQFEIADHSDPLTAGARDKLFTIKLTSLPDDTTWYYPANLGVNVTSAESAPNLLPVPAFYLLQDVNGDQRFGLGDVLLVSESEAALDASHAGKRYTVVLKSKSGNTWHHFRALEWDAK